MHYLTYCIISHSILTGWRLFDCGLRWAKELFPQSGFRHWTHNKPAACRMDHLGSWTRWHTWKTSREENISVLMHDQKGMLTCFTCWDCALPCSRGADVVGICCPWSLTIWNKWWDINCGCSQELFFNFKKEHEKVHTRLRSLSTPFSSAVSMTSRICSMKYSRSLSRMNSLCT